MPLGLALHFLFSFPLLFVRGAHTPRLAHSVQLRAEYFICCGSEAGTGFLCLSLVHATYVSLGDESIITTSGLQKFATL